MLRAISPIILCTAILSLANLYCQWNSCRIGPTKGGILVSGASPVLLPAPAGAGQDGQVVVQRPDGITDIGIAEADDVLADGRLDRDGVGIFVRCRLENELFRQVEEIRDQGV